jgi:hypothetical protein
MLAAQDHGSPDNCSKSQGGMCSVNFNAADVLRWSQRAIANRAALSRRLDSLSKAIYATDYPMTTCSFTDC